MHDSLTPWHDEIGFIPHMPGMPEAINADSFDEDVLESAVPVLVEFWTARCGPCRRLAPELLAVAEAFPGNLRVFTVDVDQELPAATRFAVHSVPQVLLFDSGAEVTRFVGITPRATLIKAVADHAQRNNNMPKIHWNDVEDIAIGLSETFPEIDPLTVRFTDLLAMIQQVPDFVGDVSESNEGKLEAVQMAWLDEYKDQQK